VDILHIECDSSRGVGSTSKHGVPSGFDREDTVVLPDNFDSLRNMGGMIGLNNASWDYFNLLLGVVRVLEADEWVGGV
jgi:hypothetical protein